MAMKETQTMTADNLFASQVMPVVADSMTIAQSGVLKRGTLIDESGAVAGADSQPVAVLAEDVDTTSAAKVAAVYLTGEFYAGALTVASGATVAGLKAKARMAGIFIK